MSTVVSRGPKAAPTAHTLCLFNAIVWAEVVVVVVHPGQCGGGRGEEDAAATGIVGAGHLEDWKYSCVGTESAAAPESFRIRQI